MSSSTRLIIPGYPHAQYDAKTKTGCLAYYYPYGVLSEDNWRHGSYSPDILNYKVGRDDSIKFFVDPFLQLIRFALLELKFTKAYLVPVPSSLATNDPIFSKLPRNKGGESRNRDDRNSVFCDMLNNTDKSLIVADYLVRTYSKPEKISWTAFEHEKSMEFKSIEKLSMEEKFALILIDDVTTGGGTLNGARMSLKKIYPQASVICLAIASSKSPNQFDSLV